MKKLNTLLIVTFIFSSINVFSMGSPVMGDGDFTNCGPDNHYDSGDVGGDYSNSENITETYCSDVPGDCIQFVFTLFNTESCCDDLTIYDGTNTGSPLIGTYAGTALPNGGTITSTTGCLTFVWSSDGSVVRPGWEAAFSCVACPAPTCSDGIQNQGETGIDCGGPCPACGTNHNIGSGNLTTCNGDLFDTGGAGAAYSSSELITETYCSDAGNCIQVTFNSFATESCCDDLTIYDGPNTGSPVIGVYAGTTLPNGGLVQSTTGCLTFVWDSDGSVTAAGWDATISCTTCPTCTDGILNGSEVGIDCGGPTCPACPCASLPVSNDEACCATPVTVNTDGTCALTTPGTVVGSTPSFNATTCFGTDDDDVWFSFVATSVQHDISILNTAGSTTDMYHAVYGGTCAATGASLVCSDADNSSVTGLTVGNTYFIRVYTYTGTGGQTSTFDVCVTDPCAGLAQPSCGLSYTHSTIGYNPQNYNTGALITFGDDRFADAYTSIGFDFCYDGVIYQDVLVSSNGYLIFPGCYSGHPLGTRPAVSAYSGYSISAAAPNTTNAPVNAIMGTWQDIYPSTLAADGEIRTQTTGAAPNRKFTAKFKDVRMFSCTTMDYNGQITIEETSDDIEVHLGEKTMCATFNSGAAVMGLTDYSGTVANIPAGYNYPTQWTVATGRPEGHLWASGCGVCVLPVELTNFDGKSFDNYNSLTWNTETEINNDYFILEKSNGGAMFEEVSRIEGSGNSNTILSYSYKHVNPRELEYYRLKQVDFNGKFAYSKIISVRASASQEVNIYPNPSKNNFSFEISESNDEVYTVTYTNLLGSTSIEEIVITKGTNQYQVNDFVNLPNGIYFVQIRNENGIVIKAEKVIKK